ncbi:phage/plasmid primase, P4 family [Paraburkholderia sp. BR10923]|uniref:phage/plasmid primase, P4 family n=1 Tax=Paraburkholderia sp. BR10923 TaxID=3236992 RepID=UPI0034CF36B8
MNVANESARVAPGADTASGGKPNAPDGACPQNMSRGARLQALSALEAEAARLDAAAAHFLGNDRAPRAIRRAKDARIAAPFDSMPPHLAGEIAASVDLNEDALAVVFASAYENRLLYDVRHGAWYSWEDTHWRQDEGARVTRQMIRRQLRKLCRDAPPRWLSVRVVDAIEKLARTDPRLCPAGPFDCNPWIIGTPAGVVDLRDGAKRKAQPGDMISRLVATVPAFDTTCPHWLAFLDVCTQGDTDMVAFLQLLCGYALTGSTRHELVFMLYGPGANGKSTFLRVLREVLGDYFIALPVETFLQSTTDQHPAGLARLEGARLAACSELPDNRAWNSQRVKDIASGELIAARYMHQNFFEFRPVCKLLFVGNHKPRLRQVDEAERRRFRLIPFVHCVPEHARDVDLEGKLRAEYPAICAWMIDGAMRLHAHGFGAMPGAVTEASNDYFAESDTMAAWSVERLVFDAALSAQSSELYADYRRWFEDNGQDGRPVSQSDFKARLTLGYGARYEHTRSGRFYRGVGLRRHAARIHD